MSARELRLAQEAPTTFLKSALKTTSRLPSDESEEDIVNAEISRRVSWRDLLEEVREIPSCKATKDNANASAVARGVLLLLRVIEMGPQEAKAAAKMLLMKYPALTVGAVLAYTQGTLCTKRGDAN